MNTYITHGGEVITTRTDAEIAADTEAFTARLEASLASKARVAKAKRNIAKQIAALREVAEILA